MISTIIEKMRYDIVTEIESEVRSRLAKREPVDCEVIAEYLNLTRKIDGEKTISIIKEIIDDYKRLYNIE